MSQSADVVVLGLGPGGEEVVSNCLNGGLSVIGIEAELVGGECAFWGCVPTKMAIRAGTTIAEARRVDKLAGGAEVHPEWAPVFERNRDVATHNWSDEQGASHIVESGGTLIRGRGRITSPRTVEVNGETYEATKALVIATGTKPSIPPIDGLDKISYWTNREAVKAEGLPESMIILGGGAIGCEFAQLFARFDVDVTLVEPAERLIAGEEPEASEVLLHALRSAGISVHLNLGASKVVPTEPLTVQLENGEALRAEVLLVATGRQVDLESIGANALSGGLESEKALPTDDLMRVLDSGGKSIEGVYAVGDVAGKGGAFTHVAVTHGRMVADQLLGRKTVPFGERAVGHVTFTDPEVGAVGLTEAAARDKGLDIAVASYPMEKVARAWMHGPGNEGILKIIVDRKSETLVGATVVGPHAGEVLSGFTAAVAGNIPIGTLRSTVWAYPTYHRGFDAVFDELPDDLKKLR